MVSTSSSRRRSESRDARSSARLARSVNGSSPVPPLVAPAPTASATCSESVEGRSDATRAVRVGVGLGQDAEQQVLGADHAVTEPSRLVRGQVDGAAGPSAESLDTQETVGPRRPRPPVPRTDTVHDHQRGGTWRHRINRSRLPRGLDRARSDRLLERVTPCVTRTPCCGRCRSLKSAVTRVSAGSAPRASSRCRSSRSTWWRSLPSGRPCSASASTASCSAETDGRSSARRVRAER